jgi:hypothetical protein
MGDHTIGVSVTPKKREKYFWQYLSAMADLRISRRTLQRWIDDMNIEPLVFEDQMKVFLTLPDVERLREYKQFMKTRNQDLIGRYRRAVEADNKSWIARLRKELL